MHWRCQLWPLTITLQPKWGRDHECQQTNLRPVQPQPPSLSPDCWFKSNRSLVSTASLVSSQSDRSEGSWHSCCGRHCREMGGYVKINLPIFKDEDMKGAITDQSWRWDLTVYHHAGCRDCTLFHYAIWSLQGYPGDLWGAPGQT